MRIATTALLPGLLLAAAPARADDAPAATIEPQLPPPLWPQNPEPATTTPVAAPVVIEQDNLITESRYARKGTMEVGASAGMMLSSQFRAINVAPSIGWFVAENFELTAIAAVANAKAGSANATTFAALLEPSYHLPLGRSMFGFLGVGVGAAYETDLGAGIALAPRIGANFLVGSSGVVSPSLQYMYVSHDQMTSDDVTTDALTNAMSVNVGYTTMW